MGPLAVAEREAAAATPTAPAGRPSSKRTAAPPAPEPAARAESSDDDEVPGGSSAAADEAPASPAAEEPHAAGFLGLYAGEDVAVFVLPGFPEREQLDDKAKIRVEAASGDNIGLVLVNSEDGSDLCEIIARLEGNTALIETAQPCFTAEGEGGMQADLSSGRAVFDGDRLSMDAEGSLFVNLGDQDVEGELSYTFQGTRQ